MATLAPTIRVAAADADPTLLTIIAEIIGSEPGMTLVGTAGDAGSTVALVEREHPDVIVVDTRMAGTGVRVIGEIARLSPVTRVVVHSSVDEAATIAEVISVGALAYVVKGAPVTDLVDAVGRAARGTATFSESAAAGMRRDLAEETDRRARRVRQRAARIQRVKAALEPGAIQAVFQPIVELASLRVVGYEALSRFVLEPRRGPDQWFAEAAEVGLEEDLEFAAIRVATGRFADIPDDAYISLNLSPASCLSERFELALIDLPGERVVVEITEQTQVPDYDALQAGLAPAKVRGARLAVDDAGAGFASLRHIARLSPDVIKVDISLTRDVDTDLVRRAIVSAFVSFSAALGMSVVAEGIETQAELDTLRTLGVGIGQGYLLGRPGDLPGAHR